MINYLRRFGVWEYILFIGGLLVFSKLVYNFMTDTLDNNMVNGVGLIVSILMMAAPSFLVKVIKQKANTISKK